MNENDIISKIKIDMPYIKAFIKAFYLEDINEKGQENSLSVDKLQSVFLVATESNSRAIKKDISDFEKKYLNKDLISKLKTEDKNELKKTLNSEVFWNEIENKIKEEAIKDIKRNMKHFTYKEIMNRASVDTINLLCFSIYNSRISEKDDKQEVFSILKGKCHNNHKTIETDTFDETFIHEVCHNLEEKELQDLFTKIIEYIKEFIHFKEDPNNFIEDADKFLKSLNKDLKKIKITDPNIELLKEKIENSMKDTKEYPDKEKRTEVRSRMIEVFFLMEKIGMKHFKDVDTSMIKDLKELSENFENKRDSILKPIFSLFESKEPNIEK